MPAPVVKASDYAFLPRLALAGRGGTTERVHAVLRAAIIEGDLQPGADIDKMEICERLGVSRFPVSEALSRLQAEGLVEILPQRGTRVTRIRIADVRQATFIRRALEAETVRTLARRADDLLIVRLDRSLHAQQAAIAADDRRGFHALDLEFHLILLDALAFGRVKLAVESARASLDRVRRLLWSPRRHALSFAEHEAVVDGLRCADSEAAGRAMETHIDSVVTELLGFSEDNPRIFEDL